MGANAPPIRARTARRLIFVFCIQRASICQTSKPDVRPSSSRRAEFLLFLLSEPGFRSSRVRRWPGVGRLVRILLFLLETRLPAKSRPAFALRLAGGLRSALLARAHLLRRGAPRR